jgi:hypothetical protein
VEKTRPPWRARRSGGRALRGPVRATVAWGRIVLQGSSAPCSCARPRAPGGYCTKEIVVHKHDLEQFGRRALLKNVDRCGKEQHRPLKVQVRHLRPAQEGPHLPGCRRRNVRDPPSREPSGPEHAATPAGCGCSSGLQHVCDFVRGLGFDLNAPSLAERCAACPKPRRGWRS